MVPNPQACAIASTPPPYISTRSKKASRSKPRRSHFFSLKEIRRRSSRRTGARHHFCDWITLPNGNQQHFGARWILEHVIGVVAAGQLIKAGPTRIGLWWSAGGQKLAQFGNLLLRMVPQIFQNRRLFCNGHCHCLAPPHPSVSFPHLYRRKKPQNVSWLQQFVPPADRQIG